MNGSPPKSILGLLGSFLFAHSKLFHLETQLARKHLVLLFQQTVNYTIQKWMLVVAIHGLVIYGLTILGCPLYYTLPLAGCVIGVQFYIAAYQLKKSLESISFKHTRNLIRKYIQG